MKMSPGHLFYFSFIISFCSLVTYEKSSAKKKKKKAEQNTFVMLILVPQGFCVRL